MSCKNEVQKQSEETYAQFLKWCKVSFYYLMATFLLLASCNFGVDETGSKYNGEVYAPMGVYNGK